MTAETIATATTWPTDNRPSDSELVSNFKATMRDVGIDTRDAIESDGGLHRVHVEGDRPHSRNGWYVLNLDQDLPSGAFGSWKVGQKATWCMKAAAELTPAERIALRAQRRQQVKLRAKADVERHAEARKRARTLWERADEADPAHLYLVRKAVRSHGLRQDGDRLIVPVLDFDGELHGLQFIGPDSTKRFLTDSAKRAHFYQIGEPGDVTVICEGYATGATISEATEYAVMVAFDRGNLRPVAEALRKRHPDVRIIIAADNDHQTADNPGLSDARIAATAVGGFVAVPEFREAEVGTDFNDLARYHGAEAVHAAIEVVVTEEIRDHLDSDAPARKPRLLVEDCNPDCTVAELRDILADAGGLYERGVPVRLAFDQIQRGTVAQVMTPDSLVLMAHGICRPYVVKVRDGIVSEVNARLPRSFAVMYLDWRGEWRLPPLNGIASAPLLQANGSINSTQGYDAASGMWCENVPNLTRLVPERPTGGDAAAALRLIRETFKTFCFADAEMVGPAAGGVVVVDTSKPPATDEFAFLVALLTAVCRPSLYLAPGVLLRAAPMSGAGAGKGLLARCICIIAFGREPHAVTAGANAEELEKRIAAELMEGSPALFLDNLNNTAFRSNLLASAITERPARVRLLGRSQMVPLNASALVILTGNGLSVSEDLARRFIAVELDPRTEDPEVRSFPGDIRAEVKERRIELLAALLTIWRWGRTAENGETGRALGSFETWCSWVRDPLLALGCKDPVDRVSEAKERDGRRQATAELFALWRDRHGQRPVALRDLHQDVQHLVDPQGRGRQYVSARLEKLAGTRIAGLVLQRQAPAGHWGAATYAMKSTGSQERHRDHRGHKTSSEVPTGPYARGDRSGNRFRTNLEAGVRYFSSQGNTGSRSFAECL